MRDLVLTGNGAEKRPEWHFDPERDITPERWEKIGKALEAARVFLSEFLVDESDAGNLHMKDYRVSQFLRLVAATHVVQPEHDLQLTNEEKKQFFELELRVPQYSDETMYTWSTSLLHLYFLNPAAVRKLPANMNRFFEEFRVRALNERDWQNYLAFTAALKVRQADDPAMVDIRLADELVRKSFMTEFTGNVRTASDAGDFTSWFNVAKMAAQFRIIEPDSKLVDESARKKMFTAWQRSPEGEIEWAAYMKILSAEKVEATPEGLKLTVSSTPPLKELVPPVPPLAHLP